MTHVFNTERRFKDEYVEGLTAAYSRYLVRIPDASGVMSVTAPTRGRTSVIVGGGSGHYPAFAGLVGPGLCDGAIIGDIFTSPSSEQAYRCIRALDGGAGVLLAFGNYTGDVLNFGLAAQRARAEGIDVRIALVTDDVASAPPERRSSRRGVAGGFFVFRAAAAAAHEGRSIGEVELIANRVNTATSTFGVAFGGCTFPGHDEPMFVIAPGMIDLGLGIHGEPGISTIPWVPAEELADVILGPILTERPHGASRARILVNGLGGTKYEELFVLYATISRRLRDAGVEIVDPEIGEFVTSLDMAGCSLSICWLEEDFEHLLASEASSPAYRAGAPSTASTVSDDRDPSPAADLSSRGPSSGAPESPLARGIAAAFASMADAISSAERDLGRLDSVAGDGDHGAGMTRGMTAAAIAACTSGPSGSDVLRAAALAFSDAAGGASGALWGAGLLAASASLASGLEPPVDAVDVEREVVSIHRIAKAALDAVCSLGGAQPGDKTMVDALAAFVTSLGQSSEPSVAAAWRSAAASAEQAAANTAALRSRRGRAAVHGDRSLGTPDPGAVSMAIALVAIGRVWTPAINVAPPSGDHS